ncbi:MAG TPA: hypothetical protein VM325_20135 [Alphaproteobacteria bacterium]|jgi:hypothetical protein|nr:hypothetical protein [Alphaproteobacteria bacterium]
MLPNLKVPHVHEAPDVEAVGETAMLLDIGPFAVFMLAHEHWHGERPAERVVERPFVNFLRTESCPAYVRHFARLVRLQAERGRLDPTEYGLRAPAPETFSTIALRNWTLALYAGTLAAIFFVVPGLGVV